MKRIPAADLRALAGEFLKLELLLAEPHNLEELRKFLILARSFEESGGVAALKALLRPQETGSAAFTATRGSAVHPHPKEASASLFNDASHS